MIPEKDGQLVLMSVVARKKNMKSKSKNRFVRNRNIKMKRMRRNAFAIIITAKTKRIITRSLKDHFLGDINAKEVRFKIIKQLGVNSGIARKIIENISWGLIDI